MVEERTQPSQALVDTVHCHLWVEVGRIEQRGVVVAAWAAVRRTLSVRRRAVNGNHELGQSCGSCAVLVRSEYSSLQRRAWCYR